MAHYNAMIGGGPEGVSPSAHQKVNRSRRTLLGKPENALRLRRAPPSPLETQAGHLVRHLPSGIFREVPPTAALRGRGRPIQDPPRDISLETPRSVARPLRVRPPAEGLPVGTFNGRFWTYAVLPLRYTPPSPAKDRAGDARHDNQMFFRNDIIIFI